jgi:hypothetical protein
MRHTFGQTLTDWTMSNGTPVTGVGFKTAPVFAKGPVQISFWSAAVGGVQYTDLIDPSGNPAPVIVSSDATDGLEVGTIPQFQGPDEVTEMWADAGSGARYRIVANDLGANVADLLSTQSDQQATLDLLAHSPGVVVYNPDTNSWPDRPADSRPYFWLGPTAPAVAPSGDLWFDTDPT